MSRPRKGALTILGQAPTAPPERADAARNRTLILGAARRLLRKKPIEDICMDAVAEEAGVGKGTLYRRFADRASLCRALLDEDARELQNTVLEGFGLPRHATWVRHIEQLFKALFAFTAEHAPLLAEASAYERGERGRFEHPAHVWQRDTLRLYLDRAMGAGEIGRKPSDITADLLLATLDPDLIRWHMAQGRSAAQLEHELLRFWRAVTLEE